MTDKEAFRRILKKISKSDIARAVGVSRQLINRWEAVPPKYAETLANHLSMPVGEIIPELYSEVVPILHSDGGTDGKVVDLIALFDERLT